MSSNWGGTEDDKQSAHRFMNDRKDIARDKDLAAAVRPDREKSAACLVGNLHAHTAARAGMQECKLHSHHQMAY